MRLPKPSGVTPGIGAPVARLTVPSVELPLPLRMWTLHPSKMTCGPATPSRGPCTTLMYCVLFCRADTSLCSAAIWFSRLEMRLTSELALDCARIGSVDNPTATAIAKTKKIGDWIFFNMAILPCATETHVLYTHHSFPIHQLTKRPEELYHIKTGVTLRTGLEQPTHGHTALGEADFRGCSIRNLAECAGRHGQLCVIDRVSC